MDGLQWKTLIKWMIWGYIPLFLETPIYISIYIYTYTLRIHVCPLGKRINFAPAQIRFQKHLHFGALKHP